MTPEFVPLGELGEIVSGSTPDTSNKAYWGGDIPWITPADLTNHQGIYFTGELRKITDAGYKSCSTKLLPAGSILFSSRAPIGHCAVTTFPLCTNQGFKSIIPNERLDSVYGFFALKFFKPQIESLGRGATFSEVNKEIFENFCIPLPPLDKQRRIAARLAKADRLRRLRRYASQIGERYLQSVFLEMFGKSRSKSKTEKLGSLTNLISSGSTPLGGAKIYKRSGKRFIRSQNVLMNRFDFSDVVFIDDETFFSMKRTFVKRNDVLLNITGASIGRVACYQDDTPANVNQHVCIIRCKPERLNPVYLSFVISDPGFQEKNIVNQSGATRQALNFSQIKNFDIPLPPLAEQERFAAIATRYERLRARQREAERQAEFLFQRLLRESFETA